MSTLTPHVLRELAIQSLLSHQTLGLEAVEYLPEELFPPVFMEAVERGQREIVKAMVQSWPFPSLPLGNLIRVREKGTLCTKKDAVLLRKRMLQPVLDGIDVVLIQKVPSRRFKLQVLDLGVTHPNFWELWDENEFEACSSEGIKGIKPEKIGTRETNKKTLKVLVDLWVWKRYPYPLAANFFSWVKERKDLVQLECKNLCVINMAFPLNAEFLEMLNFDSVEVVVMCFNWSLFFLADFAHCLGQMRNVNKLILSHISEPAIPFPEYTEQLVMKLASQLLKLNYLQEFYMDSVSFLNGYLDQVLRYLISPLKTLSVTNCMLSHADWNHLPFFEQNRQLQHLNLSFTSLTDFSPQPFRILLDNASATLTTLHLSSCGITDEQVSVFLPSLSCCSQLTIFCFIRNFISFHTMKKLLCHTAKLSNLTLEMYSPPWRVDVPTDGDLQQLKSQLQEPLRRMMRALNHPRTVWFCVHQEFYHKRMFYNVHLKPCQNCMPI